MHELSLAQAVVGTVTDAAVANGAARVSLVRLRVGMLSGVVCSALEFAFDVAADGTAAEGARLEIEALPVVVHCPACGTDGALAELTRFRCPACGTPTAEVVQGRELEIASIEVVVAEEATP